VPAGLHRPCSPARRPACQAAPARGAAPPATPRCLPAQVKALLLQGAAGLELLGQLPPALSLDDSTQLFCAVNSLAVLAGCSQLVNSEAAKMSPPATTHLLTWEELHAAGLAWAALRLPYRHAPDAAVAPGFVGAHVSGGSGGAGAGAARRLPAAGWSHLGAARALLPRGSQPLAV
jgi:hypothetical protein